MWGGLIIRTNYKYHNLYNISRITFSGSNGGETLNLPEINFNRAVTDNIEIKIPSTDLTPTNWNISSPVVLELHLYEYNNTDDTSLFIRYYPNDSEENLDYIDISNGWYYINLLRETL